MSRKIEQWQHSVLPSSSKHEGLASRLSATISELFRLLLSHAQFRVSKSTSRALEREYDYLQLWCDGYGVRNGDLDVVFAESKRLRQSTYRLLASIGHTLADKAVSILLPGLDEVSQQLLKAKAARTRDIVESAAFTIHRADDADSDTDSGSDESSTSGEYEFADIIDDLKTDIQCLVDLGPRFKEPIRDRVAVEEPALPSQLTTWNPAEYLASRIRHRYPKCDAGFTQILGQSNWDRAQRLYALKETNTREVQQPAGKAELEPGLPGTVVASDFHDSGLGTSVATPSSYAETVLSYRGAKGGSIKIPQVPPEGLMGKPFSCDICGHMCQLPVANWKTFWKRHVLSDLRPYVCIIPTCSFSRAPFSEKKAWAHHLELEHGFADPSTNIACPLCLESISSGKASHLARHLEEISLTIIPANADSDEDSDGSSGDEPGEETSLFHTKSPGPHSHAGHGVLDLLEAQDLYDLPTDSITQDKAWSEAVALFNFKTNNSHELPHLRGQRLWISEAPCSWGSEWAHAISKGPGGFVGRGYVLRSHISLTGRVSLVSTFPDLMLPRPSNAADGKQSGNADNLVTTGLGTADTSEAIPALRLPQAQLLSAVQAATETAPLSGTDTQTEDLFCRPCNFFPAAGPRQSSKMKEHRLTYGHRKRTGQGHQGERDTANSAWPCPICSSEFNRADNLRAHMRNKHLGQQSVEGTKNATTTPVASMTRQFLPGHRAGDSPSGGAAPSFVEGRNGEFSAHLSRSDSPILASSEAGNGDTWFPLFPDNESAFLVPPSKDNIPDGGRDEGPAGRFETMFKSDGVLPSHLDMARNEPLLVEETAEQDASGQSPKRGHQEEEGRSGTASSPREGGNGTRLLTEEDLERLIREMEDDQRSKKLLEPPTERQEEGLVSIWTDRHDLPWKCRETDCGSRWPSEEELKQHHATEHAKPAPLLECPVRPCPYRSKRPSNLKFHLKMAHGTPHEDNVGEPRVRFPTPPSLNVDSDEKELPRMTGSHTIAFTGLNGHRREFQFDGERDGVFKGKTRHFVFGPDTRVG